MLEFFTKTNYNEKITQNIKCIKWKETHNRRGAVMNTKIYQFPIKSEDVIRRQHEIAKKIAKDYGFVEKDVILDIIDSATDMLPEKFSFKDWSEAVIDVCEDYKWCSENP